MSDNGELECCPFCGEDAGQVRKDHGDWYVRCTHCGTGGPTGTIVEAAVKLWNAFASEPAGGWGEKSDG